MAHLAVPLDNKGLSLHRIVRQKRIGTNGPFALRERIRFRKISLSTDMLCEISQDDSGLYRSGDVAVLPLLKSLCVQGSSHRQINLGEIVERICNARIMRLECSLLCSKRTQRELQCLLRALNGAFASGGHLSTLENQTISQKR